MTQDPEKIGREILPIPDIPSRGKIALDARQAAFPPIKPLRPPEGAPNVVIVLIDDMGFGAPSANGGPCYMPAMEKVADAVCYTTASTQLPSVLRHARRCSPDATITLPQWVQLQNLLPAPPGQTSVRPNSVATIAEMLRLNGYSTGAAGKMHQTPVWEVSISGPFDRWPTGDGFEKFYGFVGGETNQWAPTLFLGTSPVEPWGTADQGYHFSEDMVDKAIAWLQGIHTMTPDKPFFMYTSFGATHAPHHVSPEWIEKYKGKFDKGWDAVREQTLANMKKKGLVPQDTKLTERPDGVRAWEELNTSEKKLYARMMEVYAGFAEHTDAQVMRLIDTLEELGEFENTLFFYIAGDNGASAEGGLDGTVNELMALNGIPQELEDVLPRMDEIGSPMSFNHYPVGWAHAMNAPYQWTKQVASHFGGTRNGMAVSWPKGIKARGEIRQQFHHVIDIVPTILEAAGLPEPYMVNGIAQKPIEGVSINYTFDNPEAEDQHITQYFEMFGNRGIYHDGWTAVTRHSIPWILAENPSFDEDVWELYDTTKDWSQANDLSKEMPKKLKELQDLFLVEAAKYNVFPLDDRRSERFNASIAGRPDLPAGRTTMTFYPGMSHLTENTVLNVKNRSHTITAEVEITEGGTNGVIIAQGGRFAGWSLYAKDGAAKYCHNWFDMEYFYVGGEKKLPTGTVNIRYHFNFEGDAPGGGGTGTLFINEQKIAEGKIGKTVPFMFSADETLDVGGDLALPVTDDYPEGERNQFSGKIYWVRIDIEEDNVSHLEPEGAQVSSGFGSPVA